MAPPTPTQTCPENCLHIDLGCPLFIEFKQIKERQKSSLVGMMPNHYLIVTQPQMVGIRSLLEQEPRVLVRYVHMGEVFGFRAEVIGLIAVPFPLVFLSYPRAVERINLRYSTRVACHLPAVLTFADTPADGMILDISSGGCRFTGKAEVMDASRGLEVGAAVVLAFPLLGTEGTVQVAGVVRNVQADRQKTTLGVQFQKMPGEILDRINAYTRQVQEFIGG